MGLVEWHVERVVDGIRIRAGFTSRAGGVSVPPYRGLNLGPHVGDRPEHVRRNRRLLAAELAVEPAWMEQVHGVRIEKAEEARTYAATDGLWIDSTCLRRCADGVERAAACVMVADCVPLLLVGRQAPVAAAVHAGRAGMLAGIVPAALGMLDGLLDAVVGPAICGGCYEVPEPMRDEARRVVAESAATTRRGTASIDVPRAVRVQLENAGGRVRLNGPAPCVFEDRRFFSHRRAAAAGNATGRFAGVVLLERVC